jgi:hypothetical protein
MNLELFKYAASGLLGAAITLVAFRTKLVLMQRQIKAQNKEIEEHKAAQELRVNKMREELMTEIARVSQRLQDSLAQISVDTERRHEENRITQATLDRRSMFTLRLMADVARKLGADSRIDDAVIKFFTEED